MRNRKLYSSIQKLVKKKRNQHQPKKQLASNYQGNSLKTFEKKSLIEKYVFDQMNRKKLIPKDPTSKIDQIMKNFQNIDTYVNVDELVTCINQIYTQQKREKNMTKQSEQLKKVIKNQKNSRENIENKANTGNGNKIEYSKQYYQGLIKKAKSVLPDSSCSKPLSMVDQDIQNQSNYNLNKAHQKINKKITVDSLLNYLQKNSTHMHQKLNNRQKNLPLHNLYKQTKNDIKQKYEMGNQTQTPSVQYDEEHALLNIQAVQKFIFQGKFAKMLTKRNLNSTIRKNRQKQISQNKNKEKTKQKNAKEGQHKGKNGRQIFKQWNYYDLISFTEPLQNQTHLKQKKIRQDSQDSPISFINSICELDNKNAQNKIETEEFCQNKEKQGMLKLARIYLHMILQNEHKQKWNINYKKQMKETKVKINQQSKQTTAFANISQYYLNHDKVRENVEQNDNFSNKKYFDRIYNDDLTKLSPENEKPMQEDKQILKGKQNIITEEDIKQLKDNFLITQDERESLKDLQNQQVQRKLDKGHQRILTQINHQRHSQFSQKSIQNYKLSQGKKQNYTHTRNSSSNINNVSYSKQNIPFRRKGLKSRNLTQVVRYSKSASRLKNNLSPSNFQNLANINKSKQKLPNKSNELLLTFDSGQFNTNFLQKAQNIKRNKNSQYLNYANSKSKNYALQKVQRFIQSLEQDEHTIKKQNQRDMKELQIMQKKMSYQNLHQGNYNSKGNCWVQEDQNDDSNPKRRHENKKRTFFVFEDDEKLEKVKQILQRQQIQQCQKSSISKSRHKI